MQDLTRAIYCLNRKFERIVYLSTGSVPDIELLVQKCEVFSAYLAHPSEYDSCLARYQELVKSGRLILSNKYISEDEHGSTFHLASIPKYSSIVEPSGIIEVLPNLSFSQNKNTSFLSFKSFLENEISDSPEQTLIVIDVNGDEIRLLQKLLESEYRFFNVVFRTSNQVLYGNSANTLDTLSEIISEYGLESIVFPESAPPYVAVLVYGSKQPTAENELKSRVAELEEILGSLQKDNDNAVNELRAKCEVEKKLKDSLLSEKGEKKIALENLKSLQKDIRRKTKKIARLESKINKYIDNLSSLNSENSRLSELLKQTDDQLADLRSENHELHSSLVSEQSSKDLLDIQLKSLKKDLERAESERSDLLEQLELLDKKRDSSDSSFMKEIKSLTNLQEELMQEKHEILQTQQHNIHEIQSLKEQCKALNEKLTSVTEEHDCLQKETIKMQSEKENLLRQRDKQSELHQQFKQSSKSFENEAVHLKVQLEKAIEKEKNANNQLDQLQKQRQELDFRQQKLDNEIAKAEAQLELIKDVVLRQKAF